MVISHRYITLFFVALAIPACQAILDIEDATVDPELVAPDNGETDVNPEQDTTEPQESTTEDSGNAETTAPAIEPECIGFDNSRVLRLGPEGTLPPLPELSSASQVK